MNVLGTLLALEALILNISLTTPQQVCFSTESNFANNRQSPPVVEGRVGKQGPRGQKGDRGDDGSVGLKGEDGIKGEDGEKGARGEMGEMGSQGECMCDLSAVETRFTQIFEKLSIMQDCGEPPASPQNGRRINAQPPYVPGTAVDYECDSYFVLSGFARSVCLIGGQWSNSAPTCLQEYTIEVESAGANDGNRGNIRVNGRNWSPRGRGHNVVIINPTTGEISATRFDTYAQPAAEMTSFLQNVHAGSIIAIALLDASLPQRFTASDDEALTALGAGSSHCPSIIGFRDSFAMVTRKVRNRWQLPSWFACHHVPRHTGGASVNVHITAFDL